MKHSQIVTFSFLNDKETLADALTTLLVGVTKLIQDYPNQESITQRSKWALTELLTNGVKHCKTSKTFFRLYVENDQLVIEKIDQGQLLTLTTLDGIFKLSWPQFTSYRGQEFNLQRNGSDSLQVLIDDNHQAIFRIEQVDDSDFFSSIENFSEHFGLLIITKSTDKFTYSYETHAGTNTFRCHFNLD
jgi:anti-sigma regulatory factor (Ser/Thr protein kinase)